MCKKTNVVLIVADDMGYGDFGKFGDGLSKTPNLDRLIEQSTTLKEHYSASPVCAPARASLMTGRYPHRTGAVDTYEGVGDDRLSIEEKTMADYFYENDYKTALIGKWHLGSIGKEYHPLNRGFQTFFGFRGGWSHYYNYKVEKNKKIIDGEKYLTDELTKEACQFIRKNQDSPFFLNVAYNAPHFPFECPEDILEQFLHQGLTKEVATLYGMIHVMDKGIGNILDTLKECALENDTIVVFMSDNGPELGGIMKRYNCNLRGEKGLVFEGGLKVPAIIRWPNKITEDKQVDGYFHMTDWLPTLISMCNLDYKAKKNLDGKDRSEMLLENQSDQILAVENYWQWNRFTPVNKCNAAVRKDNWKLVWEVIDEAMYVPDEVIRLDEDLKNGKIVLDYPRSIDPSIFRRNIESSKPLLFNLKNDPLEKENIADKYPQIVNELSEDFDRWFSEVMSDFIETRTKQ